MSTRVGVMAVLPFLAATTETGVVAADLLFPAYSAYRVGPRRDNGRGVGWYGRLDTEEFSGNLIVDAV